MSPNKLIPDSPLFKSNRKQTTISSTHFVVWGLLVISMLCFWYVRTLAGGDLPLTFTAAPPSVNITGPANGATFIAPANVTITATASDTDGTVSKVEFFQGTTKLGEDLSAPYSFIWNNVPVGSYSLTAKATDNASETATSTVVNITVNPNTPPAVTLTSPLNGSSLSVPADVTIAASASDSDGTLSKVEFFINGTLFGTDTTAPYSIKWHAPAGNHVLTAKATDNRGAVTTSGAVNILVTEMVVTPESLVCPGSSSSNEYNQTFTAVGQQLLVWVNLAPCQTIAVTWHHLNPGVPRGTGLQFTYYNYAGRVVHTKFYNGIASTTDTFPHELIQPFPWVGTIGLEGLPMYLIVESTVGLSFGGNPPTPPEYRVNVVKQSRPGYNVGGRSFDGAVEPSFPATLYGSLLTQDQGQFFKFRLEGNQTIYFSGYAQGSTTYTGRYVVDIFDASRQLRWMGSNWGPDNNLPTAFIYLDATGIVQYSKTFTNPSATAADFYIRLTARSNFTVYDFRLNLLLHSVSIASLTGVPQDSVAPLQVTVTPPTNQSPTTLILRTLSGTGEARFADDSTQMTITQTTTVQIKGVTQSSAIDNIRLEAKVGDLVLDTEDFTVTAAQCPPGSPTKPVASDANVDGPHASAITVADYQFPAAEDLDVLDANDLFVNPHPVTGVDQDPRTGREVEIWARMWRPTNLAAGPFPLVVFLHGNHGTCGRGANPRIDTEFPFRDNYTTLGTCPVVGETETVGLQTFTSAFDYQVVQNHLGYSYLAERLASWGYIVVSINANRGITAAPQDALSVPPNDVNYIDARGRLVLRHLQRLSEWNANGGAPLQLGNLQGRINFGQVGLMGHSRGGEGMRAAYDLYRESGSAWATRIPNMTVRAIFEFAPTDSGANRPLQANGVAWNVVLPMCDGDVSNLEGVQAFDRMMPMFNDDPATQKSTFTVWGANHNHFNSEWQQDESIGNCTGHNPLPRESTGSASQRQISSGSLVAFFRANLGTSANPTLNQNFDPLYAFPLPPALSTATRVEQGFTPSPSSNVTRVFDDFLPARGTNPAAVSTFANHAHVTLSYGTVDNHDISLAAALISWTSSGPERYFQSNWTAAGAGNDVSAYQTLDFRVSRRVDSPASTNFTIQLVMANGSVSSAVPLCKYADLRGPVGGPGGLHPILQTVRIPLTDFANANLSQVRGVRFVFNMTATGDISVANMRLSP
jgi:Bacterial Ig domain